MVDGDADDARTYVVAGDVPGRVLCFFLGLYAFTVFGYMTPTLATFFIDRDADRPDSAARLDALQRLLETRLPPA